MLWESQSVVNEEERKSHSGFLFDDSLFVFGGEEKKSILGVKTQYTTNSLLKITRSKTEKSVVWKSETLIKEDSKSKSNPSSRTEHSFSLAKIRKSNQGILFGGTAKSGNLNDVWFFDLTTFVWKPILFKKDELVPPARSRHTTCILENKMYLFGGYNGSHSLNDLWILDLESQTWSEVKFLNEEQPNPRCQHSASIIQREVNGAKINEMVVCYGANVTTKFGISSKFNQGDIWSLDLQTLKWRQVKIESAAHDRRGHSTVSLGKECLLLFGGYAKTTFSNSVLLIDLCNNKLVKLEKSKTWPQERCEHLMFYDSEEKRIVIQGGECNQIKTYGGVCSGIWEARIDDLLESYGLGKKEKIEINTLELSQEGNITKTTIQIIEKTTLALKKDPNDIKALVERCNVFLEMNKRVACLEDAEAVLKLDPDHEECKVNKGICLYLNQNCEEALKLFSEITQKYGNDFNKIPLNISLKILECQAKCYSIMRKYQESLTNIESYIQISKSNKKTINFDIYNTKSRNLFLLKRFDDAQKVFKEATDYANTLSGNTKKEYLSEISTSENDFQKMISSKKKAQELMEKSQELLKKQNPEFQEAINLLLEALNCDSLDYDIYGKIAEIYIQKKDILKAKDNAKTLLKYVTGSSKGYWVMGKADILQFEIARGIKYFEKGIKLGGPSSELQQAIDEAKSMLKNDASIKLYDYALDYQKCGNYEEAIDNLTKAIQINPKISKYYTVRSECYSAYDLPDENDLKNSLADAQKAIEIDPFLHQGYAALSEAYFKMKKYKSSLNALQEGIKNSTDIDPVSNPLVKKFKEVQNDLDETVLVETRFQSSQTDFQDYDKDYGFIDSLKEISQKEKKNLLSINEMITLSIRSRSTLKSLLLRAKINFKLQNFSDTIFDAKDVLEIDPNNEFAYELIVLAASSVHLSQYERAIEYLEKGISVLPNNEKLKSLLQKVTERKNNYTNLISLEKEAHLAAQRNKNQKAVEFFSKIIVTNRSVKYLYERALNYYKLKDYENSMKDLNETLVEEPTFPHLNCLKATILLDQGKIEESLTHVINSLMITPFNTPLNQLFIKLKVRLTFKEITEKEEKLKATKDDKEKLKLIGEIFKLVPNSAKFRLMRAKISLSNGRISDAKKDALELINNTITVPTENQTIEAYLTLALCDFRLKKFQKAYEWAEIGASLNDKYESNQKMDQKVFIELIQNISKAEEENRNAEYLFKDAQESYKAKEYYAAYQLISTAIQQNPTEKYFELRAEINSKLGNYIEGLDDSIKGFNSLCQIEINEKLGNYDEALKLINEEISGESNQESLKPLQETKDRITEAIQNKIKAVSLYQKALGTKDDKQALQLMKEVTTLDPFKKEYIKDKVSIMIRLDDFPEDDIQILLDKYSDWVESYKVAFDYFLRYDSDEFLQKSIYLSYEAMEKFPEDNNIQTFFKHTLEKELSVNGFQNHKKLVKLGGTFQEWNLNDFMVQPEEISLSALISEDLDLNDLNETKPDPSIVKNVAPIVANPGIDLPPIKRLRTFVQGISSGWAKYSKEFLEKIFLDVYKNASKAIFLSCDITEAEKLDNHLRKSFGLTESQLKILENSKKSDVITEIIAQRLFELKNDFHPVYNKTTMKEASYNKWKDVQMQILKKLAQTYGVENIDSIKPINGDYFNCLPSVVNALCGLDMRLFKEEYEKNKEEHKKQQDQDEDEGKDKKENVDLIPERGLPSDETKKIISSICDIFGFGGSNTQKILIFNGYCNRISSKTDPSLEFVHLYNNLLQIISEYIDLPEAYTTGELDLLRKGFTPLSIYLNTIIGQFYKTKSEKMRMMINLAIKTQVLVKLFNFITKKTNSVHEKGVNGLLNEIAKKGMEDCFDQIFKNVSYLEPNEVNNLILSIQKLMDYANIYYRSLFPSIQYNELQSSIIDKGVKDLLPKILGKKMKTIPEELFNLPILIGDLYKKLSTKKIVKPALYNLFQNSIDQWIHSQIDDMNAYLQKAVEITPWEPIVDGTNYTGVVTALFSKFESVVLAFKNILALVKDNKTASTMDDYYINGMAENIVDSIKQLCELMKKSASEGNERVKQLSLNNILQSTDSLRIFESKLIDLVSQQKEDQIIDLLLKGTKLLRTTYQNLTLDYCQTINLKTKEFINEILNARSLTMIRVQHLQTKLLSQIESKESDVLVISFQTLVQNYDSFIKSLAPLKLKENQEIDFMEGIFLLLCLELKERIWSPNNNGPYKNLTKLQVKNVRTAFSLLIPYFKEFTSKKEKPLYLDVLSAHVLKLLEYSLLDTDLLVNKYLELTDSEDELNNQIRVFLFGYLSKREESKVEKILKSEISINKGLKERQDTENSLLISSRNTYETKMNNIKKELTLMEDKKFNKDDNTFEKMKEIVEGVRYGKEDLIQKKTKIEKKSKLLVKKKKANEELNDYLKVESKIILNLLNQELKDVKEMSSDELLKEIKKVPFVSFEDQDDEEEEENESSNVEGEEQEEEETNQPETKQPEIKQPETKQPEIKQPETKQTEIKQPETKQTETKPLEKKESLLSRGNRLLFSPLDKLKELGNPKNLVTKTEEKIRELGEDVKDFGKGGVNMIKNVGQGGVDFVKDVGQGGIKVVKTVGKGSVDLVKDVGQGGIKVVKTVGKGSVGVISNSIEILKDGNLLKKLADDEIYHENFFKCINETTPGCLYFTSKSVYFSNGNSKFPLRIRIPIWNDKIRICDIQKKKFFDLYDGISIHVGGGTNEDEYFFFGFTNRNEVFSQLQNHLKKITQKEFEDGVDIEPNGDRKVRYISKTQENSLSENLTKKFGLTQNSILIASFFCKEQETKTQGTLYILRDRIFFDPIGIDNVKMNMRLSSFENMEKSDSQLKIKDEFEKVYTFRIAQLDKAFEDIVQTLKSDEIKLSVDNDFCMKI